MLAAGYRTGFVGKYGVGLRPPEGLFDFFQGLPGNRTYFPFEDHPERQLTSILGDYCLDFLEDCTAQQPFCLSLSTFAPHAHD
jgi:hypothetical protein